MKTENNNNEWVLILIGVHIQCLLYFVLLTVYEDSPPLAVVQRFVHLLDTSETDYAEELGNQACILNM